MELSLNPLTEATIPCRMSKNMKMIDTTIAPYKIRVMYKLV